MMKYRETKQPQIPVTHCAWCGSYDLEIGWQQNEAIVTFRRHGLLGTRDLSELRSGSVPVRGRAVEVSAG